MLENLSQLLFVSRDATVEDRGCTRRGWRRRLQTPITTQERFSRHQFPHASRAAPSFTTSTVMVRRTIRRSCLSAPQRSPSSRDGMTTQAHTGTSHWATAADAGQSTSRTNQRQQRQFTGLQSVRTAKRRKMNRQFHCRQLGCSLHCSTTSTFGNGGYLYAKYIVDFRGNGREPISELCFDQITEAARQAFHDETALNQTSTDLVLVYVCVKQSAVHT